MFVSSDYLMSTFHCWGNFILKTRFYSTLQFRETMHFLPCATFIENRSNQSSGVKIPWDICTRFGCYLYSTDWSWTITMDINNLLGALIAGKKKGEVFKSAKCMKEILYVRLKQYQYVHDKDDWPVKFLSSPISILHQAFQCRNSNRRVSYSRAAYDKRLFLRESEANAGHLSPRR